MGWQRMLLAVSVRKRDTQDGRRGFFLPRFGYVIRLVGTLLALRRHAWEVKMNLEAWLAQCGGRDVLLER